MKTEKTGAILASAITALILLIALDSRAAQAQGVAPTVAVTARPQVIPAAVYKGKVTRVIDGQTFVMIRDDKTAVTVRLFGVVAPLAKETDGQKAKTYLENALQDQPVRIEERGRTAGGEIIALVYNDSKVSAPPRPSRPRDPNGVSNDMPYISRGDSLRADPTRFPSINYGLLREGLVRFDTKVNRETDGVTDLQAAMEAAQKDKKGLWAVQP